MPHSTRSTRTAARVGLAVALVVSAQTVGTSAASANGVNDVAVGSPIGPHVTVLQSCSGADGRIDVVMVNVGDKQADYRIEVGHPTALPRPLARSRRIEPLGVRQATFKVPGAETTNYDVVVRRDGSEVHRQPVNPRCGRQGRAPQAPEASVVNACRNGQGFVRVFYVNPSGGSQRWSATLTSMADNAWRKQRRRQAGPRERRADVFRTPEDGMYQLDVSRGDEVIRSFFVEVDCVNPSWSTQPEQLRVLEIGFVPPSPSNPRLVDLSTAPGYGGDQKIADLSRKIRSDTSELAEMLERGSRSNNGFATQGIDVTFVDRVELRDRPPVDDKFLLKQMAMELDPADPRLDPTHTSALDATRVVCGGGVFPPTYSYDHLDNAADFEVLDQPRVIEDIWDRDRRPENPYAVVPPSGPPTPPHGGPSTPASTNGEGEATPAALPEASALQVGIRVPAGRCVYLADISRPDYPEILESQLMTLPATKFSGAGQSFCQYIEAEQIDQVWIWTDHDLQVEPAEAIMSSRRGVTFSVANESNVLNDQRLYPQCNKTYTGFNFNYTREVSTHNFLHAIEGLMSWGYPQSAADQQIFSWQDSGGRRLDRTFGVECGDAHWAPNVPRRPDEGSPTEYITTFTTPAASECFGWNPAAVSPTPNRLVRTADTKVATVTEVSCVTWNGCHAGVDNPLSNSTPLFGNTDELVRSYEVWWMQQLPGLGFEHLAEYNGEVYRVNSVWSIFADPDRFIPDGASESSMYDSSLMLTDFE